MFRKCHATSFIERRLICFEYTSRDTEKCGLWQLNNFLIADTNFVNTIKVQITNILVYKDQNQSFGDQLR